MYPRGLHVAGATENKPINFCLACEKAFPNSALHREHMRSDWHNYNLKRKVAYLPPITEDQHRQIVESAKKAPEDASSKFECELCDKIYHTPNALSNHLISRRHQLRKHDELVRKSKLQSNVTDSKEKDWRTLLMNCKSEEDVEKLVQEKESSYIPPADSQCLFCIIESDSLKSNEEHMRLEHNFSFPFVQHLRHKRDLLLHLAEKIGKYNLCIYCDGRGKTFYTAESVRKHMRSMMHCNINAQNLRHGEYRQFYDLNNILNYHYVVESFDSPAISSIDRPKGLGSPDNSPDSRSPLSENADNDQELEAGPIQDQDAGYLEDQEVHSCYDGESVPDTELSEVESVCSVKSEIIFVSPSLDKFLLPSGEIVYKPTLGKSFSSRRRVIDNASNKLSFITNAKFPSSPRTVAKKVSWQSSLSGAYLGKKTACVLRDSIMHSNKAIMENRLKAGMKINNLRRYFKSQTGFGS